MRVLVYQQLHAGHYYYYLRFLLPALLEITDDVVVGITDEGRRSAEFTDLLAPFASSVTFDTGSPSGHERAMKRERWKLHTDLRVAVTRTKPDYVLAPSGDPHTDMMGWFNASGRGGLPNHVPGEVGIHFGRGGGAANAKQVVRDWQAWLTLRSSGWNHIHLVNLMFYEWVQVKGGRLARRSSLLPHPVKPNTKEKLQSRRELGLPLDGTILGIAGVIDYRKAVVELLTAFRRATDNPDHRLLLAGPIEQKHRNRIDTEFRDLVMAGRLLLLDRFLSAEEYQSALSAMDIVCTPYPGFAALSSVLLEGLAAGRPILTNRLGWCQRIVEQFDAGWTCDVHDQADFIRGIRAAFEGSASHRGSDATARLLAFHEPANFAATFLEGLRRIAGRPAAPVVPWSWVLEGAST